MRACTYVYVDVHIHVCISMWACECVCVWEREREREITLALISLAPSLKSCQIQRKIDILVWSWWQTTHQVPNVVTKDGTCLASPLSDPLFFISFITASPFSFPFLSPPVPTSIYSSSTLRLILLPKIWLDLLKHVPSLPISLPRWDPAR